MFFVKTPNLVRSYYKGLIWNIPTKEKIVYLTFDDGPTEHITPWVLSELKKFNAKATFFCIGKNIKRNPEIFNQIKREGHAVGNHSYSHLKGWETKNSIYFKDILRCDLMLDSKLLRPPYGKIKRSQIKPLTSKYKIIMWDVLSGDYNHSISPNKCLQNVIAQTEEGSIIVFHDSVKARENMTFALPRVLKHFSELGFSFNKIPPLPVN